MTATVTANSPHVTPSKAAVNELRARAIIIPSLSLDANPAQLSPIGAAIGNGRIVGMGEDRDTREFCALKVRLFEYLAQRQGFTVLALKTSWGAGRTVDRYIQGGPGSAETAAAGLRLPAQDSPAMLDLITWMRAYNMRPGKFQSLSVAGFDLNDPAGPAKYLEFALAYGGVQPESTRATLACAFSVNKACRDRVAGLQPEVSNIADVNTRNIAQSALSNILEYIDASGARDKDEVRNPAMAHNVLWMVSNQFAGQKIILWAPRDQIALSRAHAATDRPMGYHLRQRFGRSYYSIGQALGVGKRDAALYSSLQGAAFLDLRSVPRSSALGRYLVLPGPFDGIAYVPAF
ncbi:MAG TPA: erythromycin esterase family protein [Candidatus Tumulicola sp.]